MSRRVIHAGLHFTAYRTEHVPGKPGVWIDLYDRHAGGVLRLSWTDMVAMVADLQEHIAVQQSAAVTERPSAVEVARERWRR